MQGFEGFNEEYTKEMLDVPEWCSIPSRIVQFLNMICVEDLFEDDLLKELYIDIKEEC